MKNFLFSIFLTCFFVGYAQSDFSTRSTQELLAKVNSLGHQTGDINQFFSKAELNQLQAYYQTQGKMNVNLGGGDFHVNGGASTAYGVETQADGFISFDPGTGTGITSISGGSGTASFEGAGAISNDNPEIGYAIDIDGVLYSIDVATGAYSNIGNVGIMNINGMEFAPSGTLYANDATNLYTINTATQTATLVGSMGAGVTLAVALAIDGAGVGYTYDLANDSFYSINLATGAATLIGAIGFDANFGQGMAWDSSTDTVYMAAFNAGTFMAEWRSVNIATGMTTLVGNLVGTGALTQVAWVSVVGETTNPPVGNCDLEGELADPTLGGEVWDRPLADGSDMSGSGVGVSYHVYGPFTVDTAGSYTFSSSQTDGWDGFLFVYQTAFDPADPLTNYLAGNDDGPGGIGTSEIITNLTTGTEYFMVTTSFSPADFGAFTNVITGAGTVTCGGEEPGEGCLDAENGQYPTTTFVPACNGAPEGTTGGLAWTGEYTMVQVTNGTEYIFSLSDASYFVTIGDSTGTTVLASGTGSVTWTSNLNGTVRFYAHFDSDCNWDAETFLERSVQCGDVPPPPTGCDDQTVPSNNLENGLFFGGADSQELAVDVIVGDAGFPVYGVDLNVFTDGNTDLTFSATFYEDAGGLPGAEHATTTGTVNSSELVGNAFGFDVYNYVVAFNTTVNLDANTTYWMQVESDGVAWEATTATVLGSSLVFNNAGTGGAWTVDGTGTELVYTLVCEPLGVSDMNAFDFSYYPNPVKDVLNISAKKNISNVSVNNMAGQQVINKANVNNGQVDVSSLAPGVYVFRVTLDGGQVETFKIIKK